MSALDPSVHLTSIEHILAAQRQLVRDAMAREFGDLLDFDDWAEQAIQIANSGREIRP